MYDNLAKVRFASPSLFPTAGADFARRLRSTTCHSTSLCLRVPVVGDAAAHAFPSSPEAIFDVDYLQERPEAFYTLAQELYPGNFRPTLSHYFFRLLQEKGVLRGWCVLLASARARTIADLTSNSWTQNIDTLEHLAGLKDELLVEAHGVSASPMPKDPLTPPFSGSFATATCLSCRKKFDKDDIKPRVLRGEVVRHDEGKCKGNKRALIKPDIVFFGAFSIASIGATRRS